MNDEQFLKCCLISAGFWFGWCVGALIFQDMISLFSGAILGTCSCVLGLVTIRRLERREAAAEK